MGCRRSHTVTLCLFISSLVSTALSLVAALDASIPLNTLQPRAQTTCSAQDGLEGCSVNSIFCCPTNNNCISLTSNNDSVLCCPNDQKCDYIKPIDCDIQLQNSTSHPNNSIHTTQLNATLETCAGACCPFGYTCQGGACVANDRLPDASATDTLPSTLPSATSSSPSIDPTTSSSQSSDPVPSELPKPVNHFPAPAVVLGLFIGLLGGVAITLSIVYCCIRRRRKSKGTERAGEGDRSPDFMGKTPRPPYSIHSRTNSAPTVISDPAWAPEFGGNHRTDFLLRRGDAETSYEQTNKPSWSSANERSPERNPAQVTPQSVGRGTTAPMGNLPSLKTNSAEEMEHGRKAPSLRSKFSEMTSPVTPPTAPTQPMRMKSASKRSPLFASPLRLGLSNGNQPLRRVKPMRSLRGQEMRSNSNDSATTSSGKSVASSTKRSSLKSPSKQRDESQQRPLVIKEDDNMADDADKSSLIRTDSDASSDSRKPRGLRRTGTTESSETIKVLMPPPAVFERDARHESSKTTFSLLMEQAGWKADQSHVGTGEGTPGR